MTKEESKKKKTKKKAVKKTSKKKVSKKKAAKKKTSKQKKAEAPVGLSETKKLFHDIEELPEPLPITDKDLEGLKKRPWYKRLWEWMTLKSARDAKKRRNDAKQLKSELDVYFNNTDHKRGLPSTSRVA